MKITIDWLKNNNACDRGIDWFTKQKQTDSMKVLNKLIKQDKLDWSNWLIVRFMSKPQYVAYAIFAARQVLDIYEKKYPDDKRPRFAIEVAENYLKNPNAAAYAADAANAATDAAADAANAATDAAADAADAAAAAARVADAATYATDAAADAADAAADAAAYAAAANAKNKMKLKILKYGIELLKKDRRSSVDKK